MTQHPARQWLHLYNLDGRHFFSTVASPLELSTPLLVAAALGQPGVITSETREVFEFPCDTAECGCFTFGPLAGVFALTDSPASPRVRPCAASLIWMACKDGIRDEVMA